MQDLNPATARREPTSWLHLLRADGGQGEAGVGERSDARTGDKETRGRKLVCAACGYPITSEADRIEIVGSHRHTFANPHGFVYHIGCFSQASGCLSIGAPSMEFAWFAGHSWQVAICGRCGVHLGWAFRSEHRSFHGLIVDKLAEDDAGQRRDPR